jgi:hypothetical protein
METKKSSGCSSFNESELEKMRCQIIETRPGDILYIPRSVVHGAMATSETSIHVSFGLIENGRMWSDYVRLVLSYLLKDNVALKRVLFTYISAIVSSRSLDSIRLVSGHSIKLKTRVSTYWFFPFPTFECTGSNHPEILGSQAECERRIMPILKILLDELYTISIHDPNSEPISEEMKKIIESATADNVISKSAQELVQSALNFSSVHRQKLSDRNLGRSLVNMTTLKEGRIASGSHLLGIDPNYPYARPYNCIYHGGVTVIHCGSAWPCNWGCTCDCECDRGCCASCDKCCGCDHYNGPTTDYYCDSWDCIEGYFKVVNGCGACPPGTWSAAIGIVSQSQCISCGPGKYQPAWAMKSEGGCLLCNPGMYQSTLGGIICLDCSRGDYQSLSGQSACFKCPGGKYSDVYASRECTLCKPGTYGTESGDHPLQFVIDGSVMQHAVRSENSCSPYIPPICINSD